MSDKRIIEAFEQWRVENRTLVMITVYATEGSTYSKPGHRIIIADNGDYRGLVSGGCLEGDLAEHASQVITTGESQAITYDLRDEADELFGLGIGCNGVIEVLLQRLRPESNYEPYHTIAHSQRSDRPAITAVVIRSADPVLIPGATVIDFGDDHRSWRVPATRLGGIRAQCARFSGDDKPRLVVHEETGGKATVLYAPLKPLPRLLVLGAGPDAIPLVNMADEVGWLTTVTDHRPAYLEQSGLAVAETALCVRPEELSSAVTLNRFSVAVVMTHNLANDRTYLRQLAGSDIPYVGVLGPRDRRDRLVDELGPEGIRLETLLRGPVGLDIGADSPESIALSTLAEIHQVITGHAGR